MKSKRIVGLLILVFLMLLVGGGVLLVKQLQKNLDQLTSTEIEEIDLSLIPDGIYLGEYSCFPVVVEVEVTMASGVITEIRLIKHQNGQGTPAEIILDDVLEEQSLQVDSIAGATYSSRVILLAIEDALKKAS